MEKSFKDNLLTADKMRDEIVRLQKAGKKVVFTNGVFDILHVGHLTYLEEARNLGDILVVGVNSDASVKVNKGDKRPINSERNRAFVLLGTKFVDYTVIFNEKTPEKLLDILKPDIHVKGGDYKKEDLPETKVVEKNGGEVKILSFVDNISTTEIINKIIVNKYIAILIAALTSAEIQASELVPRLIVNITIDQLNTDCLDAFASLFEENGLKKIMQNGREEP